MQIIIKLSKTESFSWSVNQISNNPFNHLQGYDSEHNY